MFIIFSETISNYISFFSIISQFKPHYITSNVIYSKCFLSLCKRTPHSWSWYDNSNSSPKHHLHLVLFINVSLPYRKTPGSLEAGGCVVYFQTVRKRRHLILRGSRQRRQASQNLSTAAFSSERKRVWKYTTQPPASHSRESLF